MNYEDVAAAYLQQPASDFVPDSTQHDSAARRLRDAIEPIAMHSVWCRATNEALAAEGLDFFSSYVWSRAALLGTPEPGVVTSAFGVFEPSMVEGVYEHGRSSLARETLLAARDRATITSLEAVLDGEDVGVVVEALQAALAGADKTGRPLFAGLAGQPRPTSPVGQLWRACELLREHRGDGHLAACVAVGLDPVEMNILTELWAGFALGTYTASRGWAPERIDAAAATLRSRRLLDDDELSAEGVEFRAAIERATDEAQRPIVSAIGADIGSIIEALQRWSQQCIAAQAFPPDPSKRAAG